MQVCNTNVSRMAWCSGLYAAPESHTQSCKTLPPSTLACVEADGRAHPQPVRNTLAIHRPRRPASLRRPPPPPRPPSAHRLGRRQSTPRSPARCSPATLSIAGSSPTGTALSGSRNPRFRCGSRPPPFISSASTPSPPACPPPSPASPSSPPFIAGFNAAATTSPPGSAPALRRCRSRAPGGLQLREGIVDIGAGRRAGRVLVLRVICSVPRIFAAAVAARRLVQRILGAQVEIGRGELFLHQQADVGDIRIAGLRRAATSPWICRRTRPHTSRSQLAVSLRREGVLRRCRRCRSWWSSSCRPCVVLVDVPAVPVVVAGGGARRRSRRWRCRCWIRPNRCSCRVGSRAPSPRASVSPE